MGKRGVLSGWVGRGCDWVGKRGVVSGWVGRGLRCVGDDIRLIC